MQITHCIPNLESVQMNTHTALQSMHQFFIVKTRLSNLARMRQRGNIAIDINKKEEDTDSTFAVRYSAHKIHIKSDVTMTLNWIWLFQFSAVLVLVVFLLLFFLVQFCPTKHFMLQIYWFCWNTKQSFGPIQTNKYEKLEMLMIFFYTLLNCYVRFVLLLLLFRYLLLMVYWYWYAVSNIISMHTANIRIAHSHSKTMPFSVVQIINLANTNTTTKGVKKMLFVDASKRK